MRRRVVCYNPSVLMPEGEVTAENLTSTYQAIRCQIPGQVIFITKERISRSHWIAGFLPVLLQCLCSGLSTTPVYCRQQNTVKVMSHPTRLQSSQPMPKNTKSRVLKKNMTADKGHFSMFIICLLKLTACQNKQKGN